MDVNQHLDLECFGNAANVRELEVGEYDKSYYFYHYQTKLEKIFATSLFVVFSFHL